MILQTYSFPWWLSQVKDPSLSLDPLPRKSTYHKLWGNQMSDQRMIQFDGGFDSYLGVIRM